jgi:Concanavalin A-like lectin/glucanases superfamily
MSSPGVFSFNQPRPAATTTSARFSALMQATPYPLMILTAIIVLVAVIVYVVMRIKKGSLKSVNLLTSQVVLANPMTGGFSSIPGAVLPNATNGTEFSYSLWIFVENISITNDHKIVLFRGNPASFSNGSFFVYMDAKTNVLHAAVRTNGAVDETSTAQTPTLGDIQQNKYFLRSTVEYVPLQRWVNVSFSVKDAVMTTYLDGDLYSVTSIYEMPLKMDGTRPLVAKQGGDVMIGGKTGQDGFNGYIGNCKYYNYAISVPEAHSIYEKGPYKTSWLSYIGLDNLGVRSPVYLISAANTN